MRLRSIVTGIVAAGILATGAGTAEASPMIKTCKSSSLTNGKAHSTCLTTATHWRTGKRRWPAIVRYEQGCHVSYWAAGGRVGPTRGEAFKAVCTVKGKRVTYSI